MSPDSLRNPFHPHESERKTSVDLTSHFLSREEAQALTEALGEDEPSKSEPQQDLPPADISMSGKEQKEVENETFWSRQRYIEWAEDFGKEEAWVDEIFKFQPDGTTVVNGELNLRNTKIKQLPIGLMEVKGDLNVSENPSFKLNGYPKKVGGSFWCNESNLTSLQGMPKEVGRGISLEYNKIRSLYELPEKVMGDLNLAFNELKDLHGISRKVFGFLSLRENNQLTSLEALKGTKIDSYLVLTDIPATEIPAGIEIGGYVYISASQTDLIADAERKGYRTKIVN